MQQQKQYIHHNIIIYFAYLTAQWQVFKKPRSKAQEQDQEQGIPGYPCTVIASQWEVLLIGYECGAKNRLVRCKGLSRHILDNRKDDCLRYSTVPLTAPVIFCHFYRQRKPSSHWYTMPPQVGLLMPSIQALWLLRGSLRAFDSAP